MIINHPPIHTKIAKSTQLWAQVRVQIQNYLNSLTDPIRSAPWIVFIHSFILSLLIHSFCHYSLMHSFIHSFRQYSFILSLSNPLHSPPGATVNQTRSDFWQPALLKLAQHGLKTTIGDWTKRLTCLVWAHYNAVYPKSTACTSGKTRSLKTTQIFPVEQTAALLWRGCLCRVNKPRWMIVTGVPCHGI